jgi:hypothetical protein
MIEAYIMNTPKNFSTRLRTAALMILLTILMINGCARITVEEDRVTPEELVQGFVHPPDSIKPWVYWYWISDNISKEGITRDLEAMARVGIGEALIGNIGLDEIPYGTISVLSKEWWELIEHAIREGKRVGVNIGLFNCPGWSQSGGPWVKSTEAMRHLVSSEVIVEGGRKILQKVNAPSKMFQDVKVLAFPAPEADLLSIARLNPRITTVPAVSNSKLMVDGDLKTVCIFSNAGDGKEMVIDLETSEAFTARSLVLYPAEKPFAADIDLQVMENGRFRTVKSFLFDRSNPSLNVGPTPFGEVAIAIPEITARRFRLIMSNFMERSRKKASDAGIAEIALSAAPRLERYIEKQLGKMHQTPFPLWNEYQWPLQEEAGTKAMKIDPASVVDLSAHLAADGTLSWEAPAGKWVIMRIGVTPTGTKNSPSAPQGRGWEVDKMNRDHLRRHFDAFIGELLRRMPAEDRTALKHVVLDSYEQGSENWTEGFADDFSKRYGYDPIPWLPVLSGRIVGLADQSNRFLWDMRRMIADRVAYDYVGGLRDLSQENGLRVWLENYGHWGFPSEFLMYGGQSNDIAGEFWSEGELGNIECRASSSAAHIYGKRRVSAESYTSAGLPFRRYPAMLKRRGDWSFTEGINHVVLHVYIQQPYEERDPGMNAWFGIEFNRKNTWFEQSKKWIDYQRRCMFMLQRGQAVNDVCYFIGEDAPKMTGIRNPELPSGYSFDYINAEVIVNRLSVEDGKLVLPDGISYRILVLPPLKTMRPELLRKIKQLVAEGATVLGAAPDRSPSMQNYPAADSEVKSMSSELWGEVDGKSVKSRNYGNGHIMNGLDMQSALHQIGVLPDVSFPENSPLLWVHRRLMDTEIYFITNQSRETLNVETGFRVKGKQPELWDPVNGTIRDLPAFVQKGEITVVPLRLDGYGSAFIVFKETGRTTSDMLRINFPEPKTVLKIDSPWQVSFDPAMRGPKRIVSMTRLEDWSKNPDESIRFYSGTATYRNTFILPEIPNGELLYVNLGLVGGMADIKVNGQPAGGVWTAPWHVDVTGLVRIGENTLEIEVVNTWANRLIGDSRLPEKDRKTWTAFHNSKPADPLEPSGLLGPVIITSVRY